MIHQAYTGGYHPKKSPDRKYNITTIAGMQTESLVTFPYLGVLVNTTKIIAAGIKKGEIICMKNNASMNFEYSESDSGTAYANIPVETDVKIIPTRISLKIII